jgi:hypothetical protein
MNGSHTTRMAVRATELVTLSMATHSSRCLRYPSLTTFLALYPLALAPRLLVSAMPLVLLVVSLFLSLHLLSSPFCVSAQTSTPSVSFQGYSDSACSTPIPGMVLANVLNNNSFSCSNVSVSTFLQQTVQSAQVLCQSGVNRTTLYLYVFYGDPGCPQSPLGAYATLSIAGSGGCIPGTLTSTSAAGVSNRTLVFGMITCNLGEPTKSSAHSTLPPLLSLIAVAVFSTPVLLLASGMLW